MQTPRATGRGLSLWALAALLLSGCGSRAELLEFNNRAARAFNRLGEADKAFYDGVYDFAYGKADPGGAALKRFHESYDRLQGVAAEARKEAEALQVPDAPGARKLQDSLLKVLKLEEGILNEFAAARSVPERRALAQRVRLRELLDATQRRKAATWAELDEVQKAFARENRINLK